MGAYVFNNQIFESWLTKMSDDILSKVNKEKITTEEMIILILKAQTNHFHHMDVEMKDEMGSVRSDMTILRNELKEDMTNLRDELKEDMTNLRDELKEDFHKLDAKMDSRFMWSIGVTITMSLGLYIKLFLG